MSDASESLLIAAMNGELAQIKRLLDDGISPDVIDPYAGNSALYNATIRDQIDAITLLLSRGANPNLRLDYRSPVDNRHELQVVALMYAISAKAAERLIAAGAKVNIADSSGVTPLIRAAQRGNENVVKVLLQAGADVAHRTAGGQCASDVVQAMIARYNEFNVGSNAALVGEKVARLERIRELLR